MSSELLEPISFVGLHNLHPTIRDFVEDLEKIWGNSKDWVLELCDGRQIIIPLSIYLSPETRSDYSVLKGEGCPRYGFYN